MFSTVLALLASLTWGSSDFFAGVMVRRTTLWAVVVVSQIGGFTATGILVLVHHHPFPAGPGWQIAMLTGICGIAAIVAFYKALSIGVMSLVAPISATGIVVPIIIGVAGGDRPSLLQWLGMALALAGIVLASLEPTERAAAGPPTSGYVADDPVLVEGSDAHDDPVAAGDPGAAGDTHGTALAGAGPAAAPRATARSRLRSALHGRLSIVLAVVSALLIGLSYAGIAEASVYDPYWTVFLMRATTLPLVLIALAVRRPALRLTASGVPVIFAVGAADVVANTLYAVASTGALLALVAVLGYLFPVVTIILAHFMLHERLTRTQQAGATAALVGALLILA
jgi:drug/metabolite transporter (DMT)-like permease